MLQLTCWKLETRDNKASLFLSNITFRLCFLRGDTLYIFRDCLCKTLKLGPQKWVITGFWNISITKYTLGSRAFSHPFLWNAHENIKPYLTRMPYWMFLQILWGYLCPFFPLVLNFYFWTFSPSPLPSCQYSTDCWLLLNIDHLTFFCSPEYLKQCNDL